MKLLEWNNYQIQVAPEALLVKPIRRLYNSDRSQKKEKFMQQMSYLFFMVDPRSTYSYIIDEQQREQEIIKQEGMPEDFYPSADLIEAMKVYGRHTTTASTKLLQSMYIAVDALAEELKETSRILAERTDKGARVTKQNEVMGTMDKALAFIPRLQELERKVDSEIKENTRAKGTQNSIFEDGV